jgi:hypothetical protein
MSGAVSGSLCQGASARSAVQRFGDIQPKIGVGSGSHQVLQTSFGITRAWDGAGAVDDCLIEFDQTVITSLYVSGTDQQISLTIRGMTGHADVRRDFDGVIEVLDVRTTLVDYPLPGMNRTFNVDTNTGLNIVQFTTRDAALIRPFIEAGCNALLPTSTFTSSFLSSTGSVRSAAEYLVIVTGNQPIIAAYDDSYAVTHVVSLDMLTVDRVNFTTALMQLSGSSDGSMHRRRIFAAGGSTYHDSTFGTDSIAFGGMMGYRQT